MLQMHVRFKYILGGGDVVCEAVPNIPPTKVANLVGSIHMNNKYLHHINSKYRACPIEIKPIMKYTRS